MAIEHDYFGVLDTDAGVRWSETVELGDQIVDVELAADDGRDLTQEGLDHAAALIRALDGFDSRARDAMIAQLTDRESATTEYVDQHVDALGDDLLDLLVHNSGDIAMDVLRSLRLCRLTVQPALTDEGEEFAVLEYSLGDDSDRLLLVSFDSGGDVVALETVG